MLVLCTSLGTDLLDKADSIIVPHEHVLSLQLKFCSIQILLKLLFLDFLAQVVFRLGRKQNKLIGFCPFLT